MKIDYFSFNQQSSESIRKTQMKKQGKQKQDETQTQHINRNGHCPANVRKD